MGMPCEVNSVLKLTPRQGYPDRLEVGAKFSAEKAGYRILPLDVPIALVDEDWMVRADVAIESLTWSGGVTQLEFAIVRLYDVPYSAK